MSLKFYIIESISQKTFFAIVLYTVTSHENLKYFFGTLNFSLRLPTFSWKNFLSLWEMKTGMLLIVLLFPFYFCLLSNITFLSPKPFVSSCEGCPICQHDILRCEMYRLQSVLLTQRNIRTLTKHY